MKTWIYRLLNELKRRNVLKTASIYLVSSWVIIQVAATIFPQLDFPEWSVRAVIIILTLGFPPALLISWFYEIIPDQGQSQESTHPRKNLGRWKWMLVIALVLMITFGVVFMQVGVSESNLAQNQPTFELGKLTPIPEFPSSISSPIVVLPFTYHNESKGESELGAMYADWISQKLLNFPEIKIVPNLKLDTQMDLDNLPAEIEYLIHGNIYKLKDTFRVVSNIIHINKNESYVFPTVKAHTGNQLDAADQTAEMIAGYWGFKEEVNQKKIAPPKFEAYRRWVEAANMDDQTKTVALLREIPKIDPDFNLVKIALMEVAPDENWKEQLEAHFSDLTDYEKAIFEMTSLEQNNKSSDLLAVLKRAYRKYPYDIIIVLGSLRAANNCQDIAFFEEVFAHSWPIIKANKGIIFGIQGDFAWEEKRLLPLHYYQKGDYKAILDLVNKTPFAKRRDLHQWKIRALVRTNQIDALEMYIDSTNHSKGILITSWAELFRMGDIEKTKSFLNKYREYWKDDPNSTRFSYMLQEDWEAAEKAQLALLDSPNAKKYSVYDGYLGMVYALSGQTQKAEEIIRKIEANAYEDPMWNIYNVGRILALLGRDEEAFGKFKEAFSKQMPFSELVYNFDPYLIRYWDYEPFWNWATPRN